MPTLSHQGFWFQPQSSINPTKRPWPGGFFESVDSDGNNLNYHWSIYLQQTYLNYKGKINHNSQIGGFLTPIDINAYPDTPANVVRETSFDMKITSMPPGITFTPAWYTTQQEITTGVMSFIASGTVPGTIVETGQYQTVRGPYIISNNYVQLNTGAKISFYWRGAGNAVNKKYPGPSTNLDVYAYLLRDDGYTETMLNSSGYDEWNGWREHQWTIINPGEYKFVFIHGSLGIYYTRYNMVFGAESQIGAISIID